MRSKYLHHTDRRFKKNEVYRQINPFIRPSRRPIATQNCLQRVKDKNALKDSMEIHKLVKRSISKTFLTAINTLWSLQLIATTLNNHLAASDLQISIVFGRLPTRPSRSRASAVLCNQRAATSTATTMGQSLTIIALLRHIARNEHKLSHEVRRNQDLGRSAAKS
mgnify:CR=1 FL=1